MLAARAVAPISTTGGVRTTIRRMRNRILSAYQCPKLQASIFIHLRSAIGTCTAVERSRGHREGNTARGRLYKHSLFPHCFVIFRRERELRAVPSALKTITHFIK